MSIFFPSPLRLKSAALGVAIALGAGGAQGAVIYVPADFPTIQQAIAAAKNGDEIVVAPGTYSESIDFLEKTVHLRSSGGHEVTVIDAAGLGASAITIAGGQGPDTVLDGFTITGGSGTPVGESSQGGGVFCDSSSPTLVACVLYENSATYGGGIFLTGGDLTLQDCHFEKNAASFGAGLRIQINAHALVTNCSFSKNASRICGGGMSNESSATVLDSTFDGNSAAIGGAVYASGTALDVTGSTFSNNTANNGGALYISPFYWGSIAIASSTFCNNLPGHVQPGPWSDGGGNEFHDTCQPIPGDLTGNGSVGVPDLLILLSNWGPCPDLSNCPADLDNDDSVGVPDLLILLANWG